MKNNKETRWREKETADKERDERMGKNLNENGFPLKWEG